MQINMINGIQNIFIKEQKKIKANKVFKQRRRYKTENERETFKSRALAFLKGRSGKGSRKFWILNSKRNKKEGRGRNNRKKKTERKAQYNVMSIQNTILRFCNNLHR